MTGYNTEEHLAFRLIEGCGVGGTGEALCILECPTIFFSFGACGGMTVTPASASPGRSIDQKLSSIAEYGYGQSHLTWNNPSFSEP